MSKDVAREWFRHNSGWLAFAVVCLGVFALGFGLGIVQSQSVYMYQRGQLTQAYRTALESKDQTIRQLAGTTVKATQQASDATSQAADAAATAADAAATAAAAADLAHKKTAADNKALGKLQ